MELKKILIFLAIISSALLEASGLMGDHDNKIQDLKWLFDIEESKSNELNEEKYRICDTKDCLAVANDFKQAMNTEVNPCDDFYEYVCGKWSTYDPIPPYQVIWGRLQKFQQVVYARIKEILQIQPQSSDILPVRQAKKWYRSCMDVDLLEKKGLKPLDSVLIQVGGWPMTLDPEEWNEEEITWQSIEEHYLHITGKYVFYDVTLNSRSMHKNIKLTRGSLPLDEDIATKYRDYYQDNYDAYTKMIERVIRAFIQEHKAALSEKTVKKSVKEIVEFEKKLYMLPERYHSIKQQTVDEFVKDYQRNISEIKSMERHIKEINFRRLIRRVFEMVNLDIEDSTPLKSIQEMDYWLELTKLLNETPKRTIVNYIHWHFVSGMMRYTTENMRNLLWQHKSYDFGAESRQPRWLECIEEMKMTTAASFVFTNKYFHGHTENEVRELIDNIRNEMKMQIEQTNWLDEQSKNLAIGKLNSMKVLVGYPEWYKNRTLVLNSYNGLTIGSDHFSNVLSYQKYNIKRILKHMPSLDEDVDPTIVNAMYSSRRNYIELPAADFQPPLFTTKLPHYINYGAVGVVIGHEIGHGFDDDGIKVGKDGNQTELSEQVMNMYYKRAECFLKQYNQYLGVTQTDYEEPSEENYGEASFGRRTRGENIADSTGLHSVFEAYRKLIEKDPKGDYKLPGFEMYTDSQMFFISFASLLCEDMRTSFAELAQKHDTHSPSRLRAIGAVSNSNDFAKAFKCERGSPMNPQDKCNIWKSMKKNGIEKKEFKRPRCYQKHHKWWSC